MLSDTLDRIMAVARVEEVKEVSPGFAREGSGRPQESRPSGRQAMKRALKRSRAFPCKCWPPSFLGRTMIAVKERFVGLHEAAHGFMPWQRPTTRSSRIATRRSIRGGRPVRSRGEQFATEVLFQLDTFRDMADRKPFEIWTPVRLAKSSAPRITPRSGNTCRRATASAW